MNASADYDLLTELTRKSGEAYSWLDNEHKRGQISDAAFHTALVALDMAMLGIAPKEYSEWGCEQRKRLKHLTESDSCAFYTQDRLVLLSLDRAWNVVRMTAIARTTSAAPVTKELTDPESRDSAEWAIQRYRALRVDLINKGFTELK